MSWKIHNNMQILHEFKDSGDDYFIQHQKRQVQADKPEQPNGPRQMPKKFGLNDDDKDAELILDHLESIEACTFQQITQSSQVVYDCIQTIDEAGMFKIINSDLCRVLTSDKTLNVEDIQSLESDIYHKEIWKATYDNH